MPDLKTLRVSAVPDVHVTDHGSAACRYIGKKCVDHARDLWEVAGVVEVTNEGLHGAAYRASVKAGDLVAADEATAKVCGVKFTAAPGAEDRSKA